MIKANQLRIGNDVNINIVSLGQIFTGGKITQISDDHVYVNGFKMPLDNLQPIPLTEKWLIKFGFSLVRMGKINEIPFVGYEMIGSVFDVYILETGNIIILRREQVITNLNYVHNLQNIWIELNKTELQLKQ